MPPPASDHIDQDKSMNVAQDDNEWVNIGNGALRAWFLCLQD